MLFLALISFDATDPSFNLVKSGDNQVKNLAGLFGSYASGFLNDFFGIGAFIWPAVFAGLGWAYISSRYVIFWWRWCGLFLLTLCLLTAASAFDFSIGDLDAGGMVGGTLYLSGIRYLSPIGTFLIWMFVFLIGLQLVCNFSWIALCQKCKIYLLEIFAKRNAKDTQPDLSPISSSQNQENSFFTRFTDKLKQFHFASLKLKLSPLNSAFSRHIKKLSELFKKRPELPFPEIAKPEQTNSFPDIRIISPKDEESNQPQVIIEDNAGSENFSPPKENSVKMDLPIRTENVQNFNPDTNIYAESDNARDNFPLPASSLLIPPSPPSKAVLEDFESRGRDLMNCFNDFGIQGELVRITPGPVITMFEVCPAAGVRVSRIVNLSDDLSLALKAVSIRIQPVAGSNTIGIEIPNSGREIVNFRELVESPQFKEGAGPLTIILGKNISGQPYMADLTKMPHLLVGGTTGAGKSVSLNSMLISLLYKLQPDELKLLLIDPKRVEMAVYSDLPHLVHPVVTEMSDAKTALEWAIHEMQNRYDTIRLLGVRSVAAYNQRLASFGNNVPEIYAHLKPIPYLVIVIDELADLMMTAAREVESSILRLLQLARAAAIHLILATQRPSVDVVTGLLKANLNCRVAFQVISRHDSRTILDETGAERLLGKGDMLFKPPAGALKRLHAPFLSDDEIQRVVNYWKQQKAPNYDINFAKWSPDNSGGKTSGGSGDASTDALYEDARAFVLEQGKASISLLQRHLKIGFNRAARIMEQFEKDGIISPADGSKPRTVIRN